MLYPVSSLQLSFSENGPLSSSEEKEKVAESRDMCYGKEIGFGSQPMKIAEASSYLPYLPYRAVARHGTAAVEGLPSPPGNIFYFSF